jgi:Uma2 family endonuclease
MTTYPIRTRRWTRKEYERLAEVGVLRDDEPIELLGGQLIVAEPKGSRHAVAVELVADRLRTAFGAGWAVRTQNSFALDDESEPEPDVAVVAGRHRDYRDAHPTEAVLIVEVAESSLAFDRQHKGSLYARSRIPEYWIVNLVDDLLEMYRDAVPDSPADFGWRYERSTIVRPGATVAPLARPDVTIAVADLFP